MPSEPEKSGVTEYRVVRSRRRSVAIEITRDAAVVVRAPLRYPTQAIAALVSQKADWIAVHTARQSERQQRHPEPDEQQLRQLREQAQAVIPGMVAQYSARMGLVPTGLHITAAKTRFGSCSGKNSVSFSCRLMAYPPEAVEYVVVHELAHIRHHDHSPAFYRLIAQYLPDYAARRELLRQ